MAIIIDCEFHDLIPPLTEEEFAGLEESVLTDGCGDALVLWGDILIDGHNRYEICLKHNLPYKTVQRCFESRDDAKLWMMRNQLSRRNLNDFQRIEITHKCENAVKSKARERQMGGRGGVLLGEKFPEANMGRANDELGAMAGVSGKTYEHAVAVMEEAPVPVVNATRRGELSINKAHEVTKMEPEQQEEIAARIEQGESPREVVNDVQKRPHVTFNSGNNEWYTPPDIIEMARNVLGEIDLDPASSEEANEVVKATKYYTFADDGLAQNWEGRVWLNPPYGTEIVGRFVDKFVEELPNLAAAIVLVNNATETEWFGKLVGKASALCFPRGRIRYWVPGEKTGSPLQGQTILYFGNDADGFINEFKKKGWCAVPR